MFAGDIPTDYVTEGGLCNPKSALEDLLQSWSSYIPEMKEGRQPIDCKFGDGSNLVELAQLLETRVSIFREWLEDDDLW